MDNIKASDIDLLLNILCILTGMINKYICCFFVVLYILFLLVHILFSQKRFYNLKKDLFD